MGSGRLISDAIVKKADAEGTNGFASPPGGLTAYVARSKKRSMRREIVSPLTGGGMRMTPAESCLRVRTSLLVATPWRYKALLAVIAMAMTSGCTLATNSHVAPEFAEQQNKIQRIALISPHLVLSEERTGQVLVPNEEWSTAAEESVRRAASDIMVNKGLSVVQVAKGDAELGDVERLAVAVDISLYRYMIESQEQDIPATASLTESLYSLDYFLGPLEEVAEKYRADAFMIVRGFNLLPTSEVNTQEQLHAFLEAIGGPLAAGARNARLMKIQIRTMIVDKRGRVLYYGYADKEHHGVPVPFSISSDDSVKGVSGQARTRDNHNLPVDLRDYRTSIYYLMAALSGYEKRGRGEPLDPNRRK